MRELGLNATSAGAIRIVRRHVVRLGLDTSHFRGKRKWSDVQLKRAVSESQSWDEVLEALGLAVNGGGMRTHVKSHAIRLAYSTISKPMQPSWMSSVRASRISST
jgi:hypothetical protein